MDGAPFPFVVGCARSGTTLLRAMLSSHPELAIPPESYFVVPVLRNAAAYGRGPAFAVDAMLDDVVAARSFGEWELDPVEARAGVRAASPHDAIGAIRALYGVYAVSQGKPRFGDKTPYHVHHIDRLAEWLPEARFVHIIRDGRGVARSLTSMHFGPNSFGTAALQWKRSVEHGRAAGARVGPQRYREVRYEELVANPDAVLPGICEFLELEMHPDVLRYYERADQLLSGMHRTDHLQGIHRPPQRAEQDWKTLSPAELALFELLAGDLRSDLGDAPSPTQFTLVHRARALQAKASFGIRSVSAAARRVVRRNLKSPRVRQ